MCCGKNLSEYQWIATCVCLYIFVYRAQGGRGGGRLPPSHRGHAAVRAARLVLLPLPCRRWGDTLPWLPPRLPPELSQGRGARRAGRGSICFGWKQYLPVIIPPPLSKMIIPPPVYCWYIHSMHSSCNLFCVSPVFSGILLFPFYHLYFNMSYFAQ